MSAARSFFEMALGKPDRYEPAECYMVGALAVHRSDIPDSPWKVSHAATGMGIPYAYGRNLNEARRIAKALDQAIDWQTIRRGRTPGDVRGINGTVSAKVFAALRQFDFLKVPGGREGGE